MKSTDSVASEFVPLTAESRALYEQFWAQVGVATTTAPPMDFLGMKAGALEWGGRLDLPAGILVKFRQRISSAQSDAEVIAVMKEFLQLLRNCRPFGSFSECIKRADFRALNMLAATPSERLNAGAATTAGGSAGVRRKGRRSMTLSMSKRAIELVDEGLSNRAIAAQLGVSEPTVRRNVAVKAARKALKGRKNDYPSGHKSKEGDIEAYGNQDDDRDRESRRVR